MTTWACPLCAYSHTSEDILPAVVKHATSEHPAYLEESATVADMLDQIPALIREAKQTLFAPNPDGGEVHVSKGSRPDEVVNPGDARRDQVSWSRTSRWVAIVVALDEALDHSLFASLVICSRIIWENLDAETKAAHPQPLGTPYWSTEIAWLSKVWPDSQAYLDKCDIDWIRDEVRSIWLAIASYAGVRRKPKYRCPTEGCKEQMHLSEGDWMTCGAGHQHPGPGRLSREWRRKPPMQGPKLADALQVPRGTLRRWAHEGRIKATSKDSYIPEYLPWDVIRVRYPDMAQEIDAKMETMSA